MPRRLPAVVLVGRPNVGKSTLFNRLTGTRRAIVTAIPGTTRDVIALDGGLARPPLRARGHRRDVRRQRGSAARARARAGPARDCRRGSPCARGRRPRRAGARRPRDRARSRARRIARCCSPSTRPTTSGRARARSSSISSGSIRCSRSAPSTARASAICSTACSRRCRGARRRRAGGVDEGDTRRLTDSVRRDAPPSGPEPPEEVGIAIVGRPNAGKSSLVNRLLREERMIVSEMPGTTRDAVDSVLTWHRRQFRIVDTAGIRRPGRVARGGQVESVSVLLARRAIEVGRHRRARGGRDGGRHRSGRRDCGRGRQAGRGRHHRRQQVGPDEGRGPDFVKEFDEAAAAAAEVPRLRARPAHLGGDRRARRRSCSRRSTGWPSRGASA